MAIADSRPHGVRPVKRGRDNGLWQSMAVLIVFGLMIAFGFGMAYILML